MKEYRLEELGIGEIPLLIQRQVANYPELIHRHNAIEIVYIEHGSGWCAVNGIVHPMLTGDLYIIPVGATHEFYSDEPLKYINLIFKDTIFHESEGHLKEKFSLANHGIMLDKYTFGPQLQSEINEKINQISTELNSAEPFAKIRSRLLFIDFLIFLIRNAVLAPGIRASHAQINLGKVLCYISDHLDSKLSLEELAAISGHQSDYFGKLFRKEIGVGLSEYIQHRRVEKACCDLAHTDQTLDEIALRSGFFDTSHFIRTFKKICGLTPAQFRRHQAKETADSCK